MMNIEEQQSSYVHKITYFSCTEINLLFLNCWYVKLTNILLLQIYSNYAHYGVITINCIIVNGYFKVIIFINLYFI